VSVNGRVVRAPSRRVDPLADRVEVDGARVRDLREHLVLALHKPRGYVTTRHEPGGRPTVYDLLEPEAVGQWVFPVGRLDRDTAGLLILTNDHRLGQELTDPAAHVPRTYHAHVRGLPSEEALRVLREGAVLEDGTRCREAEVQALGGARGGAWLEIVLTEGKNRQVRRMCAAVGHEVLELTRVRIGGFALGEIPEGSWRRLDADEIALLRRR